MNRFATILSATALSAVAFGAESYAAMPSAAAAPDSRIESTIQTMSAKDFNVIRLDSLKTHDTARERFASVSPTSQEARHVQAAVIANRSLAQKLEGQKVELTNIVGAEQAAEGGVTFYVR
ncbi:MAG: hypothetical protein ABS40_07195 [Agrobacterium sp. SCN 61-19]|nr:MAG: hypothetical protein ABS40_07195 [Agrobacterium sp. SCN 61-19]